MHAFNHVIVFVSTEITKVLSVSWWWCGVQQRTRRGRPRPTLHQLEAAACFFCDWVSWSL